MARKYAAKSTAAASLRSWATPRLQRVSNTSWAVYLTWAKGGVYLGEDGIYLGHVEARDETDAREKAIKHYNIRESERFRLNIKRK
jgi:hypothetical protein